MSDERSFRNAFAVEYLKILRRQDEPGGLETRSTDRLVLRMAGDRFSLFLPWRSPEAGDQAEAAFERREDALIFMAAWNARAQVQRYQLKAVAGETGNPVEVDGKAAGWLRVFDPELLMIANGLAGLALSSESVAMILDSTGPTRQIEIGEILGRSAVPGSADEERGSGGGGTEPTEH